MEFKLFLVSYYASLLVMSRCEVPDSQAANTCREQRKSGFVVDFVEFYSFSCLCLVNTELRGSQHSNLRDDRNTWMLRMLSLLAGDNGRYVSVVGGAGDTQEWKLEGKNLTVSGRRQGGACPELLVIRILNARQLQLFRQMFEGGGTHDNWLLLADASFPELLRKVYLPLDNKVTVVNFTEDGTAGTLWETYQVTQDLPQKTLQVGRWDAAPCVTHSLTPERLDNPNAINCDVTNEMSHSQLGTTKGRMRTRKRCMRFGVVESVMGEPVGRRRDLTGLHLRCSTIEQPPLTILYANPDGSVTLVGMLGDLLYNLHKITNFTYKTVMRRPTTGDKMWSTYTRQFQWKVWMVIFVALVVLVVTLRLVARYSSQEIRLNLSDSALVIFGFLCGQGTWVKMVSTSGRIVVVSVLMLQLLLIAHYNSDLISALAAGPSLPRINSVTDVNTNPSLGLGWRRGSSLEELFRESPSPAHRKVWERIAINDMESLVPSLEEGVKRVLQEPYLYISADISIYHTFGTDCRVFILPSSEFPIQRSLALKKDSPLIPLFNSVILDMWVFGLINKWKVTWTPPISDCNQLVVTSVDLKTVATPFILLGLATALSLALLLLERRHCPL